MTTKITWLEKPREQDYSDAAVYLHINLPNSIVSQILAKLEMAPIQKYKAKDILHDAGLLAIAEGSARIQNHLTGISDGEPLAPLLIVKGDYHKGASVVVADGYYRLCTAYALDEDAEVAVCMATMQSNQE